ncbi:MAG: NAD(P)-dependent oxidoreductase [Agriterribacter sp.]
MKKTALLGLGKMGQGIALSILKSGENLTVWNRSIEKAGLVIDAGANWADTPAKAAENADFVIAMLSDDTASASAWLGKNGALQSMKPGAFVIECSTLSLDYVQKLSGAALSKGLAYIDCPVTGIPTAAAEGKLTLLTGADKHQLEICLPLLQSFSKSIKHFGAIGKGTCYKLMINLMGAVQIAALAEGIALCENLGLDTETVIESIEASAAASPQVIRYTRVMAEKKFLQDPSFTTTLRYKDAVYALELAKNTGFTARLGKVAAQWFAEAAQHYKDMDEAMVVELMHSGNDN